MKPIEIYRQICEFTDKPSYEDLAGTFLVILRTALTSLLTIFIFSYISSLFLAGKHFNNDKELKENVSNWLKTQAATFYEEGIEKLVPRYDTCLQNFGSYMERQINLEKDNDDVQQMMDSHNQELTIDELIEMHEQKRLSLDRVQTEDRMTVGNFTEDLSLIEKRVTNCKKYRLQR
ncbi:uncharacterized protein TNCV_2544311 [Trichonephila clavipes]|nr:uncharacterized protein TNCV_2544311 [Trichonephila clavipes]